MHDLKVTEYHGIRVLTSAQVAQMYETDTKTVYTDQTEHTARCFSAYLPPIQCTLSGHQCMMLIQV